MNELALQAPLDFKKDIVEQIAILKKFARKFTSEMDDIDDLVQDTMLKAMTCFQKFHTGTNLRAWLYVLMRNIYINNYRKLNLYRRFTEVADDSQLSFSTSRVNQNGAAENFAFRDIRTAIQQLKPIQSLPFELYVTGYKYNEIASKLCASAFQSQLTLIRFIVNF